VTVIKILLILAVVALAVLVLRQHGTNRGSALAKLGMAAFLLLAAYAVIRPQDVTWLAERLGVGRGTDLVLYLLVVGFGFFAVTTYLRFKQVEAQLAALARRIALDEAVRTESDQAPAAVVDQTSGPAAAAPRG
jgi:small membrane protein